MRDVPFYQIQALKDKDMEFFFEPEMRISETGLKSHLSVGCFICNIITALWSNIL